MREGVGDLWSYLGSAWVVIPTNLGWTKEGLNVMGAGVAREAARRFPTLPHVYGIDCMHFKSEPRVVSYDVMLLPGMVRTGRVVCFPTKPLNVDAPHLSWRSPASLALIERSADQLAQMAQDHAAEVALPLVGCGLGGLREVDVLPVLHKYLIQDRFILVRQRR